MHRMTNKEKAESLLYQWIPLFFLAADNETLCQLHMNMIYKTKILF
jgi:hypothetical protein